MTVYLALTVLLLFAGVNALLYGCARLAGVADNLTPWLWHYWTPQALLGTLMLVLGGALLEWLRLRDGGKAVAAMMGASPVDYATRDPAERRLLNVTEEMAIASGLPVPAVHVLRREGAINAFVAGLTPQQTVLVVTRGALEYLDRDELQGMVAHEFSHILHGDMRLNLRVLTALSGILAIGRLGGFLTRSLTGGYDGLRNHNANPLLYAFGWLLWLIGYAGLIMGRLIKAAISRERETLADAAGIQFTRNPEGLAGALWKIGQQGSWLQGAHAESVSHLCFGEVLPMRRWLATHPPLDERIESICPGFMARMQQQPRTVPLAVPLASPLERPEFLPDGLLGFHGSPVGTPLRAAAAAEVTEPDEAEPIPFDGVYAGVAVDGRVGGMQVEDLRSAAWLHRQLPVELTRALQSATGAKAALYALMARFSAVPPEIVAERLAAAPALSRWVLRLDELLQGLDDRFALPVVDLCLARLNAPDPAAAALLIADLRGLTGHSGHPSSVFGYVLLKRVEQQLEPSPAPRHDYSLDARRDDAACLIAALLEFGSHDHADRRLVFQRIMTGLGEGRVAAPAAGEPLAMLDKALQRLRALNPEGKRRLLEACALAVESDGRLQVREYALLRVTAALLDCPMPLLQGLVES